MTDDARIRELMLINLFAVFNERDPERAQKLLDSVPDFVFTAAGPVHVLRDLGHLAFNQGVPEQPPAISGYDVALVRDGRIAVLYTLVSTGG
jgi:hypothetical protein